MGSDRIEDTFTAVAEACGITDMALRKHVKNGSAWWPKGTVTQVNGRWKVLPGGGEKIFDAYKAAKPFMKGAQDPEITEIKRQIELQKLRQLQMQTAKMERQEEFEQGNILPRDEYEVFCSEVLKLIRDQQLSMPKQLASLLPKQLQSKFIEEGTRLMVRIINQAAQRLEAAGRGETG